MSDAPAVEVSSTNEPVPPVVEQPKKADAPAAPDMSAQFLELQRRDKEIRAAKNRLKADIEASKAQLLSEIRANPLEKLREIGIAPEVLANQFLNSSKPLSQEEALALKVAQLDEKLTQKEAAEKAAHEARVLADYDKEIFAVVEKDPDSFELVANHKDGKRLYKEAVYAYWREYGEAPDLEVVAKHVEAELETDAKKLMGLKKLSPKKAEAAVAEAAKDIAAEVKSEAPVSKKKTLTSALTASSAPKVKMVANGNQHSAVSPSAQFHAEREAKLAAAYARITKG